MVVGVLRAYGQRNTSCLVKNWRASIDTVQIVNTLTFEIRKTSLNHKMKVAFAFFLFFSELFACDIENTEEE